VSVIEKIFQFLLLFYLSLQANLAFASEGNNKIDSLYKAKKILSKIHIENPITFYCKCKYNMKKPNLESCGFIPKKDFKRSSRIEWEHILPASYFGKEFDEWKYGHNKCVTQKGRKFKGRKCAKKISKQYRKMQADLYNLQPAIGEVNKLRRNYQIGIINGEIREFGLCDIEIRNKKIEPAPEIRGDVARTYMYMEQSYPNYIQFESSIRKLIITWDKNDPVDYWECKRAKEISKIQGNSNHIINKRCNKKFW
jgi:deoxyribonuclease-1